MKEIIQKMKSYMLSFSFDDFTIRRFLDNWFIKLKRNNSSEYQPPKKRRSRTKKEKQSVLPREKTIIKTFPQKFTPKSVTKVAHPLGRKKQWVINQQKRLVPDDKLLTKRPKFMSEHFKVLGKNGQILKNMSKGCEYQCGGKEEWVTCPSCERFKYRIDCLKYMFKVWRKECPDFSAEKWKCIHC